MEVGKKRDRLSFPLSSSHWLLSLDEVSNVLLPASLAVNRLIPLPPLHSLPSLVSRSAGGVKEDISLVVVLGFSLSLLAITSPELSWSSQPPRRDAMLSCASSALVPLDCGAPLHSP